MNFLTKPARISICIATLTTTAPAMNPVELRTDGVSDPIAATASPRFTWRMDSDERGQSQSAYQILVASSGLKLAGHQGDLWNSGKTEIARIPHVRYAGEALSPGGRYFWKVRAWDADGKVTGWSAPSSFEIAPLSPDDWHGAQWIDDGKDLPENEEGFYQDDPAPLMRRDFEITKPILRARLHIAGIGYALASLNGERLDDQVLDPPWTNFDKRILFRTHDVTESLTQGTNCIGITLGNGWYNLEPLRMWGHRIFRESMPSGRPRAIALLVVDHADGSQITVTTGEDWRFAEGPTVRNSIFLGETRDARREIPGWDAPGFDAAEWRAVRVVDQPLEPLQPHLDMPPVRATEVLPAVAVTEPKPGVHIVDFGRNFTGVPEMKLDVPEGTEIALRFGELLYPDGMLNPMTSVAGQIKRPREDEDGNLVSKGGPGAPVTAWQQAKYIARGGGETFMPDFTYYGFRYMEITGLPEKPEPTAFRGHFLNTDVAPAGFFSSSNELFNEIQKITRNTFLANIVSVQSDCPHRERLGYGGDIVATSEAYLMNFDMGGFYAKTVRDWADAARPDGNFTDTAPFVGIQYCGVGWAMVHPLLLEQLYNHYGDLDLVREQLPHAITWFDGEAARRENGIVMKGLGDHENISAPNVRMLTTVMFVSTANRMARLARLLGMEEEAARFEQYAAESNAAWQREFLDAKTGKVGKATQSEQLLALEYGNPAEATGKAIFERLVEDLMSAEEPPALTTGIYGTMILLEELTKRGRHDLALALANRRAFPSWGWMLENGATTLWEDWKGTDGSKSHSHPMFGSISAWLFRWIGGIQPAEDAIGFDRILIRPQVPHGMEWAKSSHQSIRGPIESNWETTHEGARFEIVIPPDTTATIELPAGEIHESGLPIAEAPGVAVGEVADEIQTIHVGSGHYRFLVKP
ncbi:MAG: family 78 glycoside hydrolase catalytic domain [Luteolibacter sp.]